MGRYDLAIIGTGPAGISAALTARNRNLNFALFGNRGLSEKIGQTHRISNFLGFPDVTGEELREALLRQLDQYDIKIREEQVGTVYSMGDYFALQVGQEMTEASTVILAAGVVTDKQLPGEKENFGKGVSYCATCDGILYKDRPVAVIADSAAREEDAEFLAGLCSEVWYFPLYRGETNLPEKIHVMREKPVEIIRNEDGADTKLTLRTKITETERSGNSETSENPAEKAGIAGSEESRVYPVDCVFILRRSVAPSRLVPGLETEGGHVKVNRNMETNLPGLFAAGDITGAPYQYMKSAGEGNVAALSAAAYLTRLKRTEK